MINRRRGKALSTNIPIYTLSGGVGRQAPSKRLPSESQELTNAMVSVERSIEKRPGTDTMPILALGNDNFTGERLGLPSGGDYEFFWHSLSEDARYLIVVNRNASDPADVLYYVFYYNQAGQYFEDQTPPNTVDDDVRAYLTHSESDPKIPLKLVSRGQNLVFLNPDVKAGYTSKPQDLTAGTEVDKRGTVEVLAQDETIWCKIDLYGKIIGDGTPGDPYLEDEKGKEVEYLTAVNVDPAGIAVFWDSYSNYAKGTEVLVLPGTAKIGSAGGNGIRQAEGDQDGVTQYYYILQAQQTVTADSAIGASSLWIVVATDNPSFDQSVTPWSLLPELDLDRTPTQVPVQDWQYPDSSKPQLGQSLPTFQDLTIPPLTSDVRFGNNGAEQMFEDLYGLLPGNVTIDSAEGKVYYIQTGYQGQAPGYYIAKSIESPYFQKVRTPDGYSLFDAKRMPVELEFVGGTVGAQWSWSLIEWAERTSGTLDTNPGPTPFRDGNQRKISTIAFYRNRLFMSSGDVIFSSRDGDFTDLWIEDPGVIVDTDPIDVAASANKYTPITSMVPFNEYMFVNTNADTQYELLGSENQITPFTSQLQPMTFYSTAPLIEPLTLGNNIFFYDAERLYLYFGRGSTLATAQELSSHCPKYLPDNIGATSVAASQDSILAVDADLKSDVYLYTTRYRGEQVLQNAFYRYHYDGGEVLSMKSWDNDVYMVVKRGDNFHIERQLMRYDEKNIPRLDRKELITLRLSPTLPLATTRGGDNGYFNPAEQETTVRVPFEVPAYDSLSPADETSYELVNTSGVRFSIKKITPDASGNFSDVIVAGELQDGELLYFGQRFTMIIQMSPQFVRDEQNNPVEGVLNLASMVTRHYNTGNYDVVVQRRDRPLEDILAAYEIRDPALLPFTTSFTAVRTDQVLDSDLPVDNVEYQGELVSKIMGYSDKTEIYILSDYFTPVNITNLDIRGKFTRKYSSIL